jgi:GT2 family glycosyltransferase
MAISRECLEAVGPWDDRYFLYSEETDYALRAGDHGYRLQLAPQAACEHATGDSHTSPLLWALLVVNRWRLFAVRHGAPHAELFRLALLLGEALRATTGSPVHRAAVASLLGGEKHARRLIDRLRGVSL